MQKVERSVDAGMKGGGGVKRHSTEEVQGSETTG